MLQCVTTCNAHDDCWESLFSPPFTAGSTEAFLRKSALCFSYRSPLRRLCVHGPSAAVKENISTLCRIQAPGQVQDWDTVMEPRAMASHVPFQAPWAWHGHCHF